MRSLEARMAPCSRAGAKAATLRGPLIELSRPVRSCASELSAGYRGRLCPTDGWRRHNVHLEVPIDGYGVPLDAVLVIVTGIDGSETKLTLRDWSRLRGRSLRCSRCGANVLDPGRLGAKWSTAKLRRKCRDEGAREDEWRILLRAALEAKIGRKAPRRSGAAACRVGGGGGLNSRTRRPSARSTAPLLSMGGAKLTCRTRLPSSRS